MRNITIDIWDKLRERISVPQREILGRTIRFTITDRGVPVNLTGSTVTMYAKKPSAAIVFNALTVITAASGIAQITLTEQMIVEAGTLECSLLIVSSTAAETRTQTFDIEVIASDDFTTSVVSTSEYNAFATALSSYSGLDARVTAVETNHLLDAWPIGSIYMSVGSTSPATLFGGTWTVFGAGKVLVGIDSGDTDFDTVEETRGAKTHALTEAEGPAHTHNQQYKTGTAGSYTNYYAVPTGGVTTAAFGDTTMAPTNVITQSSGSGTAHNNIQPSIVVRMWKRTA